MRRQAKLEDSIVINQELKYKQNDAINNRKINVAILNEQKGFCAYTEEYISSTDASDVEHFNPTLKYKDEDGYHNWYIVKHKFNQGKSRKWEDCQPTLLPTDIDFETRIKYNEGDYFADEGDIEARNLINLLHLDDVQLATNRKKYIDRKRKEINDNNGNALEYFQTLIEDYRPGISYIRAITEEFGFDIWSLL